MPIYIYACDDCGTRFERLQRFADQPLTDCPDCGGHVHRIIQPVGVIFRGSGFYVTDNRQVSSPTLKPSKDSEAAPAKATGSDDGVKQEHPGPEKEATPSAEPAKVSPSAEPA
ncbi:MAG TPA: zinc ribbon domain-containing protein [Anaerolineae bacterium]|nr:zinc ribbon domain-containing protein [Anaerolineae bacterium]